MADNCYLGIDIATENARVALVSTSQQILFRESHPLSPVTSGADGSLTQDPESWIRAIKKLLNAALSWAQASQIEVRAASISATSGTFLLVDEFGTPVTPGIMYNDRRGSNPIERAVRALENLQESSRNFRLVHTPEFVLSGLLSIPIDAIPTDWSHGLKTGIELQRKDWSTETLANSNQLNLLLPRIVPPSSYLGEFDASAWGMKPIFFLAGMTDGCTAQISAGGARLGNAVSTLGTTLVLKLAASSPISGPGFYSHQVDDQLYLVGAASNLGGASLKKFSAHLTQMEKEAQVRKTSSVIAYPLTQKGERFPVANSDIPPLWSSQPVDEIDEYLATLEGIAFAERLAYEILEKCGANLNGDMLSVGGGTKSDLWNKIRSNILRRELKVVHQSGSDIGAALFAAAASSSKGISSGIQEIQSTLFQRYEPENQLSSMYEDRYERFKELVQDFI